MKPTRVHRLLAVVTLAVALGSTLGAPAAGSTAAAGFPLSPTQSIGAVRSLVLKAAKVTVVNHVGCKAKVTFAGPGFPAKGKKSPSETTRAST